MSVPSHIQSHKLVHESSVWKWQPSRGLMSPWTHCTNWTNVPMSTPQNCPSQCPCPHSESQPPSVSSGDPPILAGKPGLQCLMRSPFLTWARVFTRPCVCPPTEEFLFPPVLFNSWDQTLLIFKDRFSGGSSYCQTPRLGSLMWDSERSLLWENFCGRYYFTVCGLPTWCVWNSILSLSHPSWRRQWHLTPLLLPGKSHGRRSLVGRSPWDREESDKTERLHFHFSPSCTGERNGNPLQYSCLENSRDGGAWWAAVYGDAQGQTRLKWLSSSSSTPPTISMCLLLYLWM